MKENVYQPSLVTITSIRDEAENIKTFRLEFRDATVGKNFRYLPGQFGEVTLFNIGEAPFSITSSPVNRGYLELCVANVGKVTDALHRKKTGETIGLRGPYGNGFPFSSAFGNDILFIAGGIGLAPLRSQINQMLSERDRFGRISILYGCRTPGHLCFRDELERWAKQDNSEVLVTVEESPENTWSGNRGRVGTLITKLNLDVNRTVAFICGPSIMNDQVSLDLFTRGLAGDRIITTLERRMECGLGKCGHCHVGNKYACLDGPVFSYQELQDLNHHRNA